MSTPTAPDRPLVRLEQVNKHFGPLHVLRDIDLDVGRGETVVVIGPSGSGKSTLCRCINRLETVDSGRIEIDGVPLPAEGRELARLRAEVGMVFQSFNLFAHKSVLDNITLGPVTARGLRREAAERRARELLDRVGLADKADQFPAQLSGGQQQRVALARALAPAPRVVLFDEAFGNLDAGLRASVREQTVVALRAAGAAGVFVTHDQGEALAVGDRVAVMRSGRVEHAATPAEAFHRPANRFVATFLGEADFLPGRQTGSCTDTELGTVPSVPGADGPVEVMLRPHELTVRADPAGTARVAAREFRGASYLYTVELASGAVVRSLQPHTVDLPRDSRVTVAVEPGHPLRTFAAGHG